MGICGSKDDEKPHKAIVSASSSDKGGSTSPSQQLAGGHAAAARPPDEVYRVFLIGDIGVGKTNLILRFCEDRFVEDDPAGVRAPIDFEYIDTRGTEQFRTISTSQYQNIDGVLVVFSLAQRESLLNCRTIWMRELEQYSRDDCPRVLVGTKSDLLKPEDRSPASSTSLPMRAQAMAQEWDMPYFETSAKLNHQVYEAFYRLLVLIKAEKDRTAGQGKL